MKYDVHLYTVVRVKMADVEADSPLEAINKAEDDFLSGDPDWLIPAKMRHDEAEYAEENIGALVDVVGDEYYELTERYDLVEGDYHRVVGYDPATRQYIYDPPLKPRPDPEPCDSQSDRTTP